MNANDVLIDLLEDNRRRLQRAYGAMSDECVTWKPEAEANNITITTWHMARILDVFLTRQAKGDAPEKECWFYHGWAEQTGYDPRGCGQNGWGMLTGYTQEEVSTIPPLGREQVLGYLNQVYDMVREYLSATPEEELLTPGAGFERKYVRHLGEIYAIKASWERHIKL
jgi:hypothetical protein